MDIKDRKVGKRYGFSCVPFSHPEFLEQLESNIKDSVLELISKGYTTIESCHGHERSKRPYIVLDKKSTNIKITQYINNIFVKVTVKNNSYLIIGRRFLFLSNKFLCKQIEKAVSKLPINTTENDNDIPK